MVSFFFKIQSNLFKYSNKSNRFQLKMESDEETAAAIVALLLAKNKKKRKRYVWAKSWLRRRINLGFYVTLVKELRFEEESECKNSYA